MHPRLGQRTGRQSYEGTVSTAVFAFGPGGLALGWALDWPSAWALPWSGICCAVAVLVWLLFERRMSLTLYERGLVAGAREMLWDDVAYYYVDIYRAVTLVDRHGRKLRLRQPVGLLEQLTERMFPAAFDTWRQGGTVDFDTVKLSRHSIRYKNVFGLWQELALSDVESYAIDGFELKLKQRGSLLTASINAASIANPGLLTQLLEERLSKRSR